MFSIDVVFAEKPAQPGHEGSKRVLYQQGVSRSVAQKKVKREVVNGELIVQFKKGVKPERIAEKHQVHVDKKVTKDVALVQFDPEKENVKELSQDLNQDPAVA